VKVKGESQPFWGQESQNLLVGTAAARAEKARAAVERRAVVCMVFGGWGGGCCCCGVWNRLMEWWIVVEGIAVC
jgi:hypothetical protein